MAMKRLNVEAAESFIGDVGWSGTSNLLRHNCGIKSFVDHQVFDLL